MVLSLITSSCLSAPQPSPPIARHPLSNLTFAVSDNFDVKGLVSGFGNPDWAKTHEPASRTAVVISGLLKHGASCVGRTVMDELGFGVTGENLHCGTPVNLEIPSQIPGGSCSGAAVSVAAGLVDFALGPTTMNNKGIVTESSDEVTAYSDVPEVVVITSSDLLATMGTPWGGRSPMVTWRCMPLM